jgi:hypothetical protein
MGYAVVVHTKVAAVAHQEEVYKQTIHPEAEALEAETLA